MNLNASPVFPLEQADNSLASVLAGLAGHDDKALILQYEDGRLVQAGYHVTEVKAGSFVTLDCGGNPDAWQETVLQVEDLPAAAETPPMSAGKFRSILAKVATKVRLDTDARLTLEVGQPGEAMRIYDVAGIDTIEDRAVMRLTPRPAICKPRHRAAMDASACCAAESPGKGSACCA